MAIKWRCAKCCVSTKLKAISDVRSPPAKSVCDVVCFAGGHYRRAAGAGAGQLRPSGERLSEFNRPTRCPGGLRDDLRTRPPLPGLELQLSDRHHRRRDLLAKEQ